MEIRGSLLVHQFKKGIDLRHTLLPIIQSGIPRANWRGLLHTIVFGLRGGYSLHFRVTSHRSPSSIFNTERGPAFVLGSCSSQRKQNKIPNLSSLVSLARNGGKRVPNTPQRQIIPYIIYEKFPNSNPQKTPHNTSIYQLPTGKPLVYDLITVSCLKNGLFPLLPPRAVLT